MSEAADKTTLATADIGEILKLLPHRYPFLLVDRIVEMNGDESCIGIKNISANEPHFQGHFPDKPIMPGVLLIEAMAQTAGALCLWNGGTAAKPQAVYFMTIDNAKFRRPVVPGDRVEFHMRKMRQRRAMWWFKGEAMVDGALVAEAEVGAMLADL